MKYEFGAGYRAGLIHAHERLHVFARVAHEVLRPVFRNAYVPHEVVVAVTLPVPLLGDELRRGQYVLKLVFVAVLERLPLVAQSRCRRAAADGKNDYCGYDEPGHNYLLSALCMDGRSRYQRYDRLP